MHARNQGARAHSRNRVSISQLTRLRRHASFPSRRSGTKRGGGPLVFERMLGLSTQQQAPMVVVGEKNTSNAKAIQTFLPSPYRIMRRTTIPHQLLRRLFGKHFDQPEADARQAQRIGIIRPTNWRSRFSGTSMTTSAKTVCTAVCQPIPRHLGRVITVSRHGHRLFAKAIRRSNADPSAFRTRDHPSSSRRSPPRASDLVFSCTRMSVAGTRSGVLVPNNRDADSNMVDF